MASEVLSINLQINGEKQVKDLDRDLKSVVKSSEEANRSLNKFSDTLKKIAKVVAVGIATRLVAGFVAAKSRIDEAASAAKNFATIITNEILSSIKNFQQTLNNFKTQAFTDLAMGLDQSIGSVIQATKHTGEFELALSNVQSVANASASELDLLRKTAIKMGKESVFSASQAADALYYLASAGLDARKSAEALSGVLDFAAATQSDLAFSSQLVVSTLNQFGMSAKQSGKVADILANTIRNSQATADRLAISLRYVGAVAKQMNIPLELTTAALGTLYNRGFEASTAGTALRSIMLKLVKVSGSAAKELKKAGVSLSEINPQKVGLIKALANLNKALEGNKNKTQILADVFGLEAVGAAMSLMNSLGDLEQMYKKLETTSSGVAKKMAEVQMDNLAGQVVKLASAWESFNLALGSTLQSGAIAIVKSLAGVVGKLAEGINFEQIFSGMNSAMKGLAGNIKSNFGNIKSEIQNLLKAFADIGKGLIDFISKNLNNTIKSLRIFFQFFARFGAGIFKGAITAINSFAGTIQQVGSGFQAFKKVEGFFIRFNSIVGASVGFIAKLIMSNISSINKFFDQIINTFKKLSSGNVFSGISKVFQTVLNQITNIIQTFNNNISQINFAAISQGFVKVGASLNGFVVWIMKVLQNGNAIKGFFDSLVTKIEIFKIVWQKIVDFLSKNDISKVGGSLKVFTAIFENMKNNFANFYSSFVGIITQVVGSIQNMLNAVSVSFSGISNIFSSVIVAISGFGKAFMNAFTQITKGNILGAFKTLLQSAFSGISGVIGNIKNLLLGLANSLPNISQPLANLGAILGVIQTKFSQWGANLSALKNDLANLASSIWNNLSPLQKLIVAITGVGAVVKIFGGSFIKIIDIFSRFSIVISQLITALTSLNLGNLLGVFTSLGAIVTMVSIKFAMTSKSWEAFKNSLNNIDFSPITSAFANLVASITSLNFNGVLVSLQQLASGVAQVFTSQQFIDAGAKMIQALWQGMKQAFSTVASKISELFNNLASPEGLQNMTQKISSFFANIMQSLDLSKLSNQLQAFGHNVGVVLSQALTTVFSSGSDVFAAISAAIGSFLTGLFSADNLMKYAQTIYAGITALVKAIFGFFVEDFKSVFLEGDMSAITSVIMKGLVAAFALESISGTLLQKFVGFSKTTLLQLSNAFELESKGVTTKMATDLFGNIKIAFNLLVSKAGEIGGIIKNYAVSIIGFFKTNFGGIAANIQTFLTGSLLGQITTAFITFFASFKIGEWIKNSFPAVDSITNEIAAKIIKMYDGIKVGLSQLPQKISEYFATVKQTIHQSMSNFMSGLMIGVSEGIMNATQFLSLIFPSMDSITQEIKKFINFLDQTVEEGIKNWLTSMSATVGEYAGYMSTAIASIFGFDAIATLISEGFTALSGVILNMINAIKDVIANSVSIIKTSFTNLFAVGVITEAIKSSIEQIKNTTNEYLKAFIEGIKSYFNSAVSEVSNAFAGIWEAIKTSWENTKAWFKGAVNFIKSWVNGIVAKFKSAIDAVKNVASKIKNMLVGHSPPPEGPLKNIDTGAENIAKAWVASFTKGLNVNDIKNALSNVAKVNVKAIPTRLKPATAAAGGVNINIHNPQMWTSHDLNRFASEVQRAVKRADVYGLR